MSLPETTKAGAVRTHARAAVSTSSSSAPAAAVSVSVPERARAYLACLPVSVQGQGGHNAAFRAACVLVHGFALGEQEALPLLLEWNTRCQPPWTEAELRHKLLSAAQNPGDKPPGHLLEKESFSSSYSYSSSRKSGHQTEKTASGTQALRLEILTHDDIRAIAALRGIYPDAVDLAYRWGFLKMTTLEEQRCFLIHEGPFAQARRLDGKPFTRPDGAQIKARNLPGSTGAFIGKTWLERHPHITHVLLVEGCIGLIEALAALCLVDVKAPWCVIAATSASSRFARDPQLLETLRGKHVRIIPDADPAGLAAASSWMADLGQASISHDAEALPGGCKDLGALLALPETDPRRQKCLEDIFRGA